MTEQTSARGISRRTVAKGAAWAVPTVALASNVPAYAVSYGTVWFSNGNVCKLPGGSCDGALGGIGGKFGYLFSANICTDIDQGVTVTVDDATVVYNQGNTQQTKTFEVVLVPGTSCTDVTTGTTAAPDSDVVLTFSNNPGSGTRCCPIQFVFLSDNSANLDVVSASAPFTYTYVSASGPETKTGTITLVPAGGADTPPCVNCQPPTVTPAPSPTPAP